MSGFLERLRKKPHETRKRYALGTSATVTGLIFVMWLTVLNHGFLNSDSEVRSLNNSQLNQTASPLSVFSNNASSAFRQFRDEFSSFDESATGRTATSGDSEIDTELPDRSTERSHQNTASEGNYWSSSEPEASEGADDARESSQVMGATDENDTTERTPFNSRNYNPQQESDWFSN